jgi:hypothetical protein
MRDQHTSSTRPASQRQQDLSPSERTLRARVAAHVQWSREPDPTARTANGRAAFLARFEAEVDPDGTLTPEERHRRAEHARRAYFTRLALASAKARRARREGRGGARG